MKELIAGFIIDNLYEPFANDEVKLEIAKKLTTYLSHFYITSKTGFENKQYEYSPFWAVIINLIQRGTPTKLNFKALENIYSKSDILKLNDNDENKYYLEFNVAKSEIENLILRSLHIIDPRITKNDFINYFNNTPDKLQSEAEKTFLFNNLPAFFEDNGTFIFQLTETQRSINSIINERLTTDNSRNIDKSEFTDQRTDFSIDFPYENGNNYGGLVIEVDGSQHKQTEQIFLDRARDRALLESGWKIVRIMTSELKTKKLAGVSNKMLNEYLNNDYIFNCHQNYIQPIWNTSIGMEILQLTLIPFGIARIQRTFIEYLTHHQSLIKADIPLKIAIVERDIPCGIAAFDDLKILADTLIQMQNTDIHFPEVEVEIFSTQKFINSKYQVKKVKNIEDFDLNNEYDLLIDVALLDKNVIKPLTSSNSREQIYIRSVHYPAKKRKIITGEHIKYKSFGIYSNLTASWNIQDNSVKLGLDYLLKSIFRKKAFRPGQLPILHNALQCKSVIGLLPTGGGKSLTYQLSALLQPGVCIIIDPIKSLMKDQVRGLNNNLIDSCTFINSSLESKEKRRLMKLFSEGEVQFLFISPERLQMEEFRTLLEKMNSNGLYFSSCVIDEAHCVSEWGHDFRTAYLKLGENASVFCKTKNQKQLPLFALTATASFDVLTDIQRELSGKDENNRLAEDAIIRSEYTKRDELQYTILEATIPISKYSNEQKLKQELAQKKVEIVKDLLKSVPQRIKETQESPDSMFSLDEMENNAEIVRLRHENIIIKNYDAETFYNNYAALIFCPHTKGPFGVTDKWKTIEEGKSVTLNGFYDTISKLPGISAGYFVGTGEKNDDATDESSKNVQEESFDNQDKYLNNTHNLMVATKAFGMGIDKENIRYSIHINYPGSIESYVQEAGRAGRDRKIAFSYILFNDQEFNFGTGKSSYDNDFDINYYFHKNSFKGIQKELEILKELLTNIDFPNRTFEIENLLINSLEENIQVNFWEKDYHKRLYFNLDNNPLGYIDLNNLRTFDEKSSNTDLSKKIFEIVKEYFKSILPDNDLVQWIKDSYSVMGIESVLASKNIGEKFSIVVGFKNNVQDKLLKITNWLIHVVHYKFNIDVVKQIKKNSTDATSFIEEVCKKYKTFSGNNLNFEMFCANRDKERNVEIGTAYNGFMALVNGYRDKLDTEKAIYRLNTLGIIDDYTANFSSRTFTLTGTKKTEEEYRVNLKNYLCKYYSDKISNVRLKELGNINETSSIMKLLIFLVNFVYKEIQKKRMLAIQDMKSACRIGLEKGSVELKVYIDLYFNSKYARAGYSFENDKGVEILASLPDLTDYGKNDDIQLVWKFIEYVEIDPKAGQIDNLKHLRGACTRMLNIQPDNYTLLLLNAFTLYMLEYKNPRYLQEAESLIINAFYQITVNEKKIKAKQIQNIYLKFTELMQEKNPELKHQMEQHNFSFDFNNVLITRYLQPLKFAKHTIIKLNQKLN